MATIAVRPGDSDKPATEGRMLVVNNQGKLYVRKWPEKRGPKKTPYQQETVDRFVDANRMAKLTDSEFVREAMTATKNSGLYPRDVLVKASLTGLFELVLPDGRLITRPPLTYEVPVFNGARVYRTTTYTPTINITTPISFQAAALNPIGIWNAAAPTLFTVPAGVSVVEMSAGVSQSVTVNNTLQVEIADAVTGVRAGIFNAIGNTNKRLLCYTGAVPVIPGQTFRVGVFQNTTTVMSGGADLCWFSMNVLG